MKVETLASHTQIIFYYLRLLVDHTQAMRHINNGVIYFAE